MVHILVVILKFMGIVLAAVLGLLLFLFLLCMVAPIRYHLDGQAGDKIHIEGRVSWLFFVLRCKIKYDSEEGMNWFFRIFGVLAASNEESFVTKKEAKRAKKEAKEAKKKLEENSKVEQKEQEIPVSEEELSQDILVSEEDLLQDIPEFEEDLPQDRIEDGNHLDGMEEKTSQKMLEEIVEDIPVEEPSEEQKTSVIEKIKNAYLSLKDFIEKIYKRVKNIFIHTKKKITDIPIKFRNIKNRLEKIWGRIEEIKEFFLGQQNKEVIGYILNICKKIAHHLLPNKFQGKVEFGLEDPYTMGQILALLGMLMPIYQDKLVVIPDFEEQKLKGEVSLSGTIIPGYMIFWLLKLILNKEVRRVIKDGKTLIGGNI